MHPRCAEEGGGASRDGTLPPGTPSTEQALGSAEKARVKKTSPSLPWVTSEAGPQGPGIRPHRCARRGRHGTAAKARGQAQPHSLPYLLPRLGGQVQDPEVLVVVELLSVGRGELPSEDPQLPPTVRHHHRLRKKGRVRAGFRPARPT